MNAPIPVLRSFLMHDGLPPSRADVFWHTVALIAAGLGIWARFSSLGASALAIDEYYLLSSAHNVLAHGLPQFDCGGYYTRGLLHQYATAGTMYLGMAPEVAIRFPSAVAGLVSVLGAYLLARHVGGRQVAAFVAALMFLSLWQVEFARFGRMYAPFQACTVFYALAALKYFELSARRDFWWLITISIVANFTHEGGALLAAFTVLAVFLAPKRLSFVEVGVALAVFVAAAALVIIDFRHLGTQDPYAAELLKYLEADDGDFSAIDLPVLPPAPTALLGLLITAGIGVAAVLSRMYRRVSPPTDRPNMLLPVLTWTAVTAAMTSQLFLLAAVTLAAATLFGILNPRTLMERRFLATLAACTGLLVGIWTAYALLAPESGGLMGLIRGTLRYPDFYLEVWHPWKRILPYLGSAIVGASIGAGVLVLFAPRASQEDLRYRLLLAVVAALLTAAILGRQPYYATRYTYFLYPLLLILLVHGAVIVYGRITWQAASLVPFLLVAAVFIASNDFSLRHLLRVDQPEYLYRKAYDRALAEHFYPRWDYRGVAQALNAQATPDDLVITIAYPVMPYYSRLFDFVYVDRSDPRIWIVSACEGRRDLWSNLPLVFDPAQLRELIENAGRLVWLVLRTEQYLARRDIEAELLSRYGANEVYRSTDGNLALLRIP